MSALAANPQLLLNLQGLVDAGHLNPEEFAAEKTKLFDAPLFPPSNALVDTLSSISLATQSICATQVELIRYLHGCRIMYSPQPGVTTSGVSPIWIPSPMCPGPGQHFVAIDLHRSDEANTINGYQHRAWANRA